MKAHHITFGRMNPVTKGHEAVVKQISDSASKEKAGHTIILSHSHDAKKNPLSPEDKLKHAKRAFPNSNVITSSKEKPTILHHASDLHSQGVTHLTVHVGSDRVDATHELLNKYNGVEGKHGHYNFKSIKVVPVGKERKEGDDIAGASGTKMREYASSGDKENFHKMAPSSMSKEHKDEMYHDVRKSMNIKEGFKSFLRWLRG